MANCECLATCPFFNDRMANMPMTAEVLKKRLCQVDNSGCARYKVFKALGKENVPTGLMPNQTDKADEIIARAK